MATILCVDDEPAVGVIMEHTLTKIGHRPLLVSSVEEAMQMVTRTPLDLIIADYRMPRLTGLDLLGLLDKEGYRVPVIIMTGYSSIEHAVIVHQVGGHRLSHQADPGGDPRDSGPAGARGGPPPPRERDLPPRDPEDPLDAGR